MEPDEIGRRLEELREKIRRHLEEQEPPTISGDAPDVEAPELPEAEAHSPPGEPGLNSTVHLERANERAAITGPVELTSRVPLLGPLLTGLRKLARPFVQPILDPYLDRQERFNAEVVRHLNELGSRLETRLDRVFEDLRNVATDPGGLEARLESSLADYDMSLRQRFAVLFDGLEEELWALRSLIGDHEGRLEAEIGRVEIRLVEYAQAIDRRFEQKDRALERAIEEVRDLARQSGESLSEAELLETRTLLAEALETVRTDAAASGSGDGRRESEAGRPERLDDRLWQQLRGWMNDQDYRAFQNRFRGDEEAIRARMEGHVERFEGVEGPVADLGCGRGEFLELLRDAEIASVGVEINEADVQDCRSRGLEAVTADLFEWLEGQSEGSLGGIFAAQVIEHLPPTDWSRLVRLAVTRLEPGGRLVLETLNPESVFAMFRAYVIDPTHVRPVHPDLLAFLASRAGLAEVGLHYQAEVPDGVRPTVIDTGELSGEVLTLAERVNERLSRIDRLCCAPQEYTLVASRVAADVQEDDGAGDDAEEPPSSAEEAGG